MNAKVKSKAVEKCLRPSVCNQMETRRAMAELIWRETQKQLTIVANMSSHAAFFFSGAYKKHLAPETVEALHFNPLVPPPT